MAVFRIEKTRDYTVMSNYHLRDMSLSLKAKGLLAVIDWLELAVGGDVLHLQGQLVDFRPGIPKVRFQPGSGGGCHLAPIQQFFITADTMLRQKVGGIRDPFQIFDGRPAAITCFLLLFFM